MHITHVYIDGFKRLMHFNLTLNEKFNVIVGDNETGKTSVLEAINLVLTRQYDKRAIDYTIDPYLFNAAPVWRITSQNFVAAETPPRRKS